MDNCKRCTLKGDLDKCLSEPCSVHDRETWFIRVILDRNAELKREIDDLKHTALTALDIITGE